MIDMGAHAVEIDVVDINTVHVYVTGVIGEDGQSMRLNSGWRDAPGAPWTVEVWSITDDTRDDYLSALTLPTLARRVADYFRVYGTIAILDETGRGLSRTFTYSQRASWTVAPGQ